MASDLQVLTGLRNDLMGDWMRGINRSVFLALEAALDYFTRLALILLTGFETRSHSALPVSARFRST